MIIYSFKESF